MPSDYTFWLGEDGDMSEIDRLRTKCDKQAMMLRHLFPDRFADTYFIHGEWGTKDSNGLPEGLLIVPAYGCDFSVLYKRTEDGIQPEW